MLSFDPNDPSFAVTGVPFDRLAEVRANAPVCPIPQGGWFLSRREEVVACLKDVDTFRADLSRSLGNDFGGVDAIPPELLFLSEIPEPRHGHVRRLYNMYFGPQKIARLEPFVREIANALIDPIAAAGGGDLVGGWAVPIPGQVIARVIGVPQRDAAQFVEWSGKGLLGARAALGSRSSVELPPIRAYIEDQLAQRRAAAEPPDDVFTLFMRAEIDGQPLTDAEIATQIQFMVLAGVGTTWVLIAHLFHILMHDPDLYARIRNDRTLVPAVVEETLRYASPVQSTPRRAMADSSLGGVEFVKGDWVYVGLGSANRDESAFDEPAAFRLDRANPRDHVAFGTGSHVCPGASLARMEVMTSLGVFLDRVEALSIEPGFAYEPIPGTLETPHRLPCRVVPARVDG